MPEIHECLIRSNCQPGLCVSKRRCALAVSATLLVDGLAVYVHSEESVKTKRVRGLFDHPKKTVRGLYG